MTELTKMSALGRLGQEFTRLEEEGASGRRTGRFALVVLAVAVIATAVALTPPGRAIADRIGELVGIGDESTGLGDDSVVLGVGEGPSGEQYEIFATTEIKMLTGAGPHPTCVGLNVPSGELGVESASCLTDDGEKAVERDIISPIAKPPPTALGLEGMTLIQGLARGDVGSIELEHRTADGAITEIPVRLFSLDEKLGEAIASDEDVGYFFALIPDGLLFDDAFYSSTRGTRWGSEAFTDRREEAVEESFTRIGVTVTDDEGAVLIDEPYSALTLPSWWRGVALGPRAGHKNGAIQVEPPATIRKAPKPSN